MKSSANRSQPDNSDSAYMPSKHRHADLTSGRAKFCQVYPREFCRAVCEGIAAQKKLYVLGMKAEPLMTLEEMFAVMPENLKDVSKCPSGELHEDDAGYVLEDGTVAFDDQSNAPLKPDLVRAARVEEIKYFRQMGVYDKIPLESAGQRLARHPLT